jgi:DNA-binding NarL/FixJ family response regulator
MSEQQTVSILAVCVDESTVKSVSGGQSFLSASSARQAIDLLRMLRFDLLITGKHLPDMPVFNFVSKVKSAWPWQKWALVSSDLTSQEEVIVRTLGVLRIFDQDIENEALVRLSEDALGEIRTRRTARAS